MVFDVLEVSKGSKYVRSAEISYKKEVSDFFKNKMQKGCKFLLPTSLLHLILKKPETNKICKIGA